MSLFKKLSFEDESKLESFLSRYPETSIFLRSNLRNSGIEYKDDLPYHGEYFAYCNSLGEIQGIIAHYWNGNIMMQCPDLTALKELFQALLNFEWVKAFHRGNIVRSAPRKCTTASS